MRGPALLGPGLLGALLVAGGAPCGPPAPALAPPEVRLALERIVPEDLRRDVELLASDACEGRYAPGPGYELAARHVAAELEAAGFEGAGPGGSFLLPVERRVAVADPERTRLLRLDGAGGEEPFRLGVDLVPIAGCPGEASGPVVFAGFGVSGEGFDELGAWRAEWRGALALCFEGEPEHPTRFDGPEISGAADVHAKVAALGRAGAAGVLVVRRRASEPMSVRAAWAGWSRERDLWRSWEVDPGARRELDVPALELSPAAAERLLGRDPWALAREIESAGEPRVFLLEGLRLELASDTRSARVPASNVVGLLRGRDPERADEVLVLGAHLDHLGVDPRGRVARGADDNASGVAAVLAVARALGAARPARSVLACAFAAEEHGLVGSQELCRDPPVPRRSMVAMLNLDMVGRGDPAEVVCIGTRQNPELGRILAEAARLAPTGVEEVVTGRAGELWQRSDQYSFHSIGVPSLFFFERVDIDRNEDYHTFRDDPEELSIPKIANTARLVFLLSWSLAESSDRPPAPRR